MSTICNLTEDLIGEILRRVPLTSLQAMRSTCKLWNTLLKDPPPISKEIMFITTHHHRACLMSANLLHDQDDSVYPFIKQIGKLKKHKIPKVFHCSGLLLCLGGNNGRLRVWNPYTGHHTCWIRQPPRRSRMIWNRITSWIRRPRNTNDFYGMGYDSNNNHKILKVSYSPTYTDCEIYDFKYHSWRTFDISTISLEVVRFKIYEDGVSLKGNNYFLATGRLGDDAASLDDSNLILCFDFTRERFHCLLLPQYPVKRDFKALSLVSDDKLAVLSWRSNSTSSEMMEIWITNKIEPKAVSWSHFLKVDHIPFDRFNDAHGSFFVDEKKKKKVAVICCESSSRKDRKAFMVGEGGQYRELDLGTSHYYWSRPMCTTYVPSLMQIQ